MPYTIHFEATELVRHNYSYDYEESDFNEDVERFKIEGVNYSTLCKILRGEMPDQPIRFMGSDFDENDAYYASDLFMDLIREHCRSAAYDEVEELDDSWEETTNVR